MTFVNPKRDNYLKFYFSLSGLVAACDDGHLRVWKIPDEGLLSPTNDPELDFPAHSDKIQMVKFHPLAKDVLLTVAFDKSVKIWNLNDISEPAIELNVRLTRIMVSKGT